MCPMVGSAGRDQSRPRCSRTREELDMAGPHTPDPTRGHLVKGGQCPSPHSALTKAQDLVSQPQVCIPASPTVWLSTTCPALWASVSPSTNVKQLHRALETTA